jgi:hypothetical protein
MRHHPKAYDLVPFEGWTWIADSQEDVFGNIRTYPIGAPLCRGCDEPVTDNKCRSCEVEFMHEVTEPLAPVTRDIDPQTGNERVAA